MFDLWLGVAFLLVIALGFICMPLFMSLRGSELKRQASNVVIYKSQLEDLKADLESGRIEQAEYDSLSKEINLNLLVDTEEQKQVESNQSGNWIFIPSVALILVVSIGLYMKLGAENELAITQMLQASNQSGFTREDAGKLIERLKVQTQDTPEDIEMWYL
ncbi:MAG: c-type cytochrome biogenesis protein CcmI, partial [Gammaproteobacteria bacterium]|nr:c-type cytochrome biogenesis protein CcmI [Gammaproteobacteria bacterium]